MSNYSKLIILVQLDLQIVNLEYIFYVNISSYYTTINNGSVKLVKFISTLDNTSDYSNKDKIKNFFEDFVNYKLNNILDKYYLVFISNYEDIDMFKQLVDIYKLNDTDINLLIRMFNYIKGFFTSSIFKNIYQVSSDYEEYNFINTRYKIHKLINYPDPNLNINNDTLINSLKHYIETILITSNISTIRFNDINNTSISYKIGNALN